MSELVKIGVAGAGVFGGYHAGKYANSAAASLAGVFDINVEGANKLAALHGAQVFDDYSDLLTVSDAVVVTSPATAHYALVRQALEAGRHVFVEKPLALEPEEADALAALAEEQNLVLQVGHQERYVADAIGFMGYQEKPLKVECVRYAALSDRCRDVSAVFDLMIHDLDLVRQLTKSDLEGVTADGSVDEVRAELTLTGGIAAVFEARRSASPLERRMRLTYSEGFIEIDFINRRIVNTTAAVLQDSFGDADAPLALTDPLGFGAELFIAAIAGNEKSFSPRVTGRDGADAVAWARAVEDALPGR